MLAQPRAYIRGFIREGFPPKNFARRVPPDERVISTRFQEGLNNHGAHLKKGTAIVVHPKLYERGNDLPGSNPNDPPVQQYIEGEGPQHPKGLLLLKETITAVIKDKHNDAVVWLPDYLYLPAREDEAHTRAIQTKSGRTVFEYDPNFDLGNGKTTKMGMLLLEDGGPRGPQNSDGTYQPGPGGPFFFDFG
ncbi:hypothetical protein K458DRAFT_47933 [Lentithecium fluviatile CBS 122367]|uniref:Uncharacterized protein n=1 Tax=Lentithecium fluviatile CBS 122367 TaxID=1168545 RepID=A0A6G1IXC4_9PLEO|nr:hypothetical protein K458DRAFT_47933 [Lentithecium fluviatile CBS 122367]